MGEAALTKVFFSRAELWSQLLLLRLCGEETPLHPSAPIAQYPCNWFGFHFLTVVKAIDLLG